MADITTLPVMTTADAESIGCARFNDVPTLPIDIPDESFTLSARTTDGRRITFFFGEYQRGAAPSFVDIQYHDHGATIPNANGGRSPIFDMLTIGLGGRQAFDSRKLSDDDKSSIAVILLGEPRAAAPSIRKD
ncbi:hypothetical protein [Sphingobium sp. D43FB]|uniref:hypothetical protein n=1 Tax=Sphingobium sp. D43FB TaxID=2017595 RepID=UPI000BB53B52|nr:hypothetical protein [Sphingobium sp. D43FB]PBN42959.1 hypothetical protein SxD43FB_14105 [Sphingobium sp. D43FB]